MKLYTLIIVCLFVFTTNSFAQLKNLKLKNCVVVGQFDKPEDRFTIESAVTGILNEYNIKTTPSVNYVKTGGNATVLAEDSLSNILKEKGFDTYVIISVRGYDRKFKPSKVKYTFKEKLDQGTLREIYRTGAVNVSFEFAFYRNNELVATDIIKCGNISDRTSTMKRFNKKTIARVDKAWR
ncbi:MAG: hypothetical protein M9916_13085 [Crocinitomicaceae bacterium]|nr:hypothetical protein [Crocinitomicaceae bacterium]